MQESDCVAARRQFGYFIPSSSLSLPKRSLRAISSRIRDGLFLAQLPRFGRYDALSAMTDAWNLVPPLPSPLSLIELPYNNRRRKRHRDAGFRGKQVLVGCRIYV